MKAKAWYLGVRVVAVVGLAVLAWMPAAAAEDLAEAVPVQEESAEACLDYTPVEGSELEPTLLLGIEGEAVAPKPKPCRQACPDQPWCTCSYSGGGTRISCDPCCYQTWSGVICTS
jgi:hypothetical protein